MIQHRLRGLDDRTNSHRITATATTNATATTIHPNPDMIRFEIGQAKRRGGQPPSRAMDPPGVASSIAAPAFPADVETVASATRRRS